ncbi:hypothetical protein [Mycobacterium sp. URHB0021]
MTTVDAQIRAEMIARAAQLAAEAPPLSVDQALMLRSMFCRYAHVEELAS